MPVIEQAAGVMEQLKPELFRTLADLVRIPSENLPPKGHESACQTYLAARLRELGIAPDIYELAEVPGLTAHPEFWPGRDYAGRPNVNGVLKGKGGGRSLILSGHIDTVPIDTPVPWTREPLGARIENGRLYGRGAWDMKAGVAMNLTVLQALLQSGVRLSGDVIFESVVDEEFGGANGTLAGRLRGYPADAAIIGEPTGLRICPAQRGGRTLHVTLRGPGGMLQTGKSPARAVDQLTYVLARLPEFGDLRQSRVPVDPYYASCSEPFAVWVTNISTGEWGWRQPITVAECCRVELYWQTMPAESGEEVVREFLQWWDGILAARPDLFPVRPEVTFPMRWLPGSSIPRDTPLVREFQAISGAPVEGLDAPSDMYVFQKCFGIPAVMWGPAGAHAHQPDEYVELDSLYEAARALLRFVIRWAS